MPRDPSYGNNAGILSGLKILGSANMGEKKSDAPLDAAASGFEMKFGSMKNEYSFSEEELSDMYAGNNDWLNIQVF